MTNLEALQSLIEYSNDTLFEKIMLDRRVVGTAQYQPENQKNIDLCFADVCLYLITHPDFREGGLSIKYTISQLMTMRNMILKKYNIDEQTIYIEPIIDGESQW
jgi:hypothetical protein